MSLKWKIEEDSDSYSEKVIKEQTIFDKRRKGKN